MTNDREGPVLVRPEFPLSPIFDAHLRDLLLNSRDFTPGEREGWSRFLSEFYEQPQQEGEK